MLTRVGLVTNPLEEGCNNNFMEQMFSLRAGFSYLDL